jgi:putative transposase
MTKWVSAWRKDSETAYLAEVPVHVLQNVVRALDDAFQRFFNKEGGYRLSEVQALWADNRFA